MPRRRRAEGRRTAQTAAARAAGETPLRVKLSHKETRELAALPERIAALEHEQADISQRLAGAALYRDEPGQVKVLQARLSALENELALSLARWEELETRNSASQAPVND